LGARVERRKRLLKTKRREEKIPRKSSSKDAKAGATLKKLSPFSDSNQHIGTAYAPRGGGSIPRPDGPTSLSKNLIRQD